MTEQEIRANRPILRVVPPVEEVEVERTDVVVGEAAGTARISGMFAAEEHVGGLGMFAPSDVERAKLRREGVARSIFLIMALALVIPVILVLGDLLIKAWPALSWGFLTTNPQNRMTAVGILVALVGTFCLVLLSRPVRLPRVVLRAGLFDVYTR